MLRFIRSLVLGLLLGALLGLYMGWTQAPTETRSSSLGDLARAYQDEYLVMIAAGYAAEADISAAVERLNRLDHKDIPGLARESTQRIIQSSARDLADIALLAHLADGLGQLSEAMAPFLDARRERA